MNQRHYKEYYKHTGKGGFEKPDYHKISHTEDQDSLLSLVVEWLERMPYYNNRYWRDYQNKATAKEGRLHKFWVDYRAAFADTLIHENEHSRNAKLADFDKVFFRSRGSEDHPLTSKASRSGLFIMLYRDQPLVRYPYEVLRGLVEIDELMSIWRYRHLMMVRRMIGLRQGTGGTSGAGYLEGALQKHAIFKDIAALSTYLIPRNRIPELPRKLQTELGF